MARRTVYLDGKNRTVLSVSGHQACVTSWMVVTRHGYQESIMVFGHSLIEALEDDEPSAMVKTDPEAAGYLFSLSLGQPLFICGNMWDDVTNPHSGFYLRNLCFEKPESRKQREKSYYREGPWHNEGLFYTPDGRW